MNEQEKNIQSMILSVLLSDEAAEGMPAERRIYEELVRIGFDGKRDFAVPPMKGIEDGLRVRMNGVILERPTALKGWLVYRLKPAQLALGRNVVGLKVKGRSAESHDDISIEKLEISVTYRR